MRKSTFSILLLINIISGQMFGEDEFTTDSLKQTSLCGEEDPYSSVAAYFIPYYSWACGETIGIEEDYHRIGGFYALPNVGNTALGIIQGNVLFIEKNIWAGSVGAGIRFFDSRWWGANIFYDFRKKEYGSFHQIGVGYESFFYCFDVRANLYFPLSSTKKGDLNFYSYPEGGYQATCYESAIPMYAANGELGRALCLSRCYGVSSYAAIGPYFLGFHDENAVGVRFRAAITYLNIIWLELVTTYDRIFGALVQGQLTLSFPFQFLCGSFHPCYRPRCSHPPLIERFDAIPLRRCCNWTWNW